MPENRRDPERSGKGAKWHNNFFTSHLKHVAWVRDLLSFVLTPAQLALFDLDTLTVASNVMTSTQDLKALYSDLLVKVRLRDHTQVVVSILVEHKSGPDADVMRQLLRYMSTLYEKDVDAVLPIIIYHGAAEWRREKSFRAFEHARLSEEFVAEFGSHLIDFRAVFVSLREPAVRERLRQAPAPLRLVLHAMANIWEADERAFIGWLELVHALPGRLRRQLLNSVYFYFLNVCEEVKMERLQKELEANEPGDEIMQEIHAQMEDLMSVSVGEIRQQGLLEGMERGMERGALRKAQDIAKRFIADGWSNEEIRKYTDLSVADINQLREASGAG